MKLHTHIFCGLGVIFFFWCIASVGATDIFDSDWRDPFTGNNTLVQPGEGDAVDLVRDMFFLRILPQFKYLFAFVAILIWTTYILLLITSAGNEDTVTNNRQNLIWSAVGFLTISLAVMVGEVFAPRPTAEIVDIPGVQLIFQKIIGIIQLFLTPIAVTMIAYAGIKLIIGSSSDDEAGHAKNILKWGLVGLVIAMVAAPLVNQVFYPSPDAPPGAGQQGSFAGILMDIIRFFLYFLGVLVLISFLLAGTYYLTSFGDEERHSKARAILTASVLGILLILMSFVLISAIVPGDEVV